MIRDLRAILDGWDFEPGKISVRKIIGRDGREKLQTRIDLGVLQLECHGRPDGEHPHGKESLLDYHEQRLHNHIETYGDDEDFILTPEDCRDLRHEAYLYYQRYLSLFVLEEYDGVESDTERNLRVIALCERYAAAEHDRTVLAPQQAYVMMMRTRARAQLAMEQQRHGDALQIVDAGCIELEQLADADMDADESMDADAGEEASSPVATELETLENLRAEILEQMPADTPTRLQSELREALAREDYEGAAKIRDQLAHHPDGGSAE